MIIAPTLATERLTLRPFQMADLSAYTAFIASDRSQYMGGPHDKMMAWAWFCNDVALWALTGLGGLMVTDTKTGTAIGTVNVINPPHFPETEIGWIAFAGSEGRGYITEAARAIRDWAFGPRGLTTLVSYIDPANIRSVAVAERLGAVRDLTAATPHDQPTGVWRINSKIAA